MPRLPTGVYEQPFPDVIPDTTIESAVYNGFVNDVETDLNTARPIVAGGTGSSTAAGALTALGAVAKAGDTMTGDLTITKALPSLILNRTTDADASIVGKKNGNARWELHLGETSVEPGDNTQSNLALHRFNDAGAFVGTPLIANRATGQVTLANNLTVGTGIAVSSGGVIFSNSVAPNFYANAVSLGDIRLQFATGYWFQFNQSSGDLKYFANSVEKLNIAYSGESTFTTPIVSTAGRIRSVADVPTVSIQTTRAGQTGFCFYNVTNQLHVATCTADGTQDVLKAYWDTTGNYVITAQGLKPGGGLWADSSDARIKNVVGDYDNGLASILTLNPVRFTYKGNDTPADFVPSNFSTPQHEEDGTPKQDKDPVVVPYANSPHYKAASEAKEFIGLIAQECETAFPEMVTQRAARIDGVLVNDMRNLDTTPLIFALVNAVKTLTARIEALEAA